jgi:hypothetical protein
LRGETRRPVEENVDFTMHVIEIAMDFSSRDLASCKPLQDVIDHGRGPELGFETGWVIHVGGKLATGAQRGYGG